MAFLIKKKKKLNIFIYVATSSVSAIVGLRVDGLDVAENGDSRVPRHAVGYDGHRAIHECSRCVT